MNTNEKEAFCLIRQNSCPFVVACLFLIAAAICSASTAHAAPPTKPNFLFILIDDMGYADLSCFGGTRVQTTNIDRLAREGIRFTQFYVNAPICSPSRVAFTTGQYPNRWRITSYLDSRKIDKDRGVADWLDPRAPSLARMLHDAGYYTAHVGKWHMGGQRDVDDAPMITDYGFDTSLTSFEGLGERIHPLFDGVEKPGPWTPNSKTGHGSVRYVERYNQTKEFVDRALAEIDRAKEAHKPFYINLWPDDVHSPCLAPKELRGDNSAAANYVGVLKELDNQLGRAFERIRADASLRDNTIIILASDNGPEHGLGSAGDLRGSKGQLYEGGIREPLIVWSARMAAKSAGSTNDTTVIAGMDLPPSLLAIANVASPADVNFDGLDMSSAILGESAPQRSSPIMWVRPPDRPGPNRSWPDLAIRDGKWKLLVNRDGSKPELFDVVADPNESMNLADKQPELTQKLAAAVIAWEHSTSR
jgi:uncharacterized sulfatase